MVLTSIKTEGSLVLPDLEKINELSGQQPKDFHLPKTTNLTDEIASCWSDLKNFWTSFQKALDKHPDSKITGITRDMWVIPVLRELGYAPLYTAKAAETSTGKTFAISHRADDNTDSPPVHIISARQKLGEKLERTKYNPHQLIQTYLNEHEHLWALLTNGLQWRLIRDCSLMSKSSFVEIDLEQIMTSENFSEFAIFYKLLHRTRFPNTFEDASDCLLEQYHQMAIEQGGRVREKLRIGVEKAIEVFGQGLLAHPANTEIKKRIIQKKVNSHSLQLGIADEVSERGKAPLSSPPEVTPEDYYKEILLFIYRILFLMVAESRNLLFDSDDAGNKKIYEDYYSLERLRRIADKRSTPRGNYTDLWKCLKITFNLFDENHLGQNLNLSPLNGRLFSSESLAFFNDCELLNTDLITIIKALSVYSDDSGFNKRVNYSAIDVEELGSVYESLLDLHPDIEINNNQVKFSLIFGMERKTTGSYYTRADLVGELIKSTLEPVIEERLKTKDPEKALLDIKVIDPACGSGHFILAATRKIAEALAQYRKGEDQPDFDDIRHAKRDVITHCIYGVDLNPLAVDLCRVSLWIEGFERGKPLTFLDHKIKCGNSLVGVFDNSILKTGIPDDAYKAVTGDEKPLATQIKRKNKTEREQRSAQLSLFAKGVQGNKVSSEAKSTDISNLKEDTPEQVKAKEAAYQKFQEDEAWVKIHNACDLWTYAFFAPITQQEQGLIPTSIDLFNIIDGSNVFPEKLLEAREYIEAEKFFHWECEFPEVFIKDGFDVVIGNPPWEKIKIAEKEFFASRDKTIANAINASERGKLINALPKTNPELYEEFNLAKKSAENQSNFVRKSGRFELTAVGDVNTYALFAENFTKLLNYKGRAGIITPTGIATDNGCKDFFGSLVESDKLIQLLDFENKKTFFPAVHASFKFCLLSMGNNPKKVIRAGFFLTNPNQIDDERRVFETSSDNYKLFNPNTKTSPVFRTSYDAKLAEKIYKRVPVLVNEITGKNPWNVSFMRMLDMSNDSGLFKTEPTKTTVPLYEAKLMHQYDHRWATYDGDGNTRDLTDEEKQDHNLTITPRYWVDKQEVDRRLNGKWDKEWLIVYRRITNTTNERTVISSIVSKYACGDPLPIVLPTLTKIDKVLLLLSNFNSIIFDFLPRQKIGGTHLDFHYIKQLPVLPPESYTQLDITYIKPRVLELVYSASDLKSFAIDMGYNGEPFKWDIERRAILKAELDAYYAKLYDLTKEELLYILDPQEIFGSEYPGETFRVLKERETRHYGEYKTKKLVMEAFEQL